MDEARTKDEKYLDEERAGNKGNVRNET